MANIVQCNQSRGGRFLATVRTPSSISISMNSRVRLRPKSKATPSVANAVKSVAPNDKAGLTAVVSSENTKNPTAESTIGTAIIASM